MSPLRILSYGIPITRIVISRKPSSAIRLRSRTAKPHGSESAGLIGKRGFSYQRKSAPVAGAEPAPDVPLHWRRCAQPFAAARCSDLEIWARAECCPFVPLPPDPEFLDECDRIGLLVMDEFPAWQYVGRDAEWQNNAVNAAREMILRDRNHPSVFLWACVPTKLPFTRGTTRISMTGPTRW